MTVYLFLLFQHRSLSRPETQTPQPGCSTDIEQGESSRHPRHPSDPVHPPSPDEDTTMQLKILSTYSLSHDPDLHTVSQRSGSSDGKEISYDAFLERILHGDDVPNDLIASTDKPETNQAVREASPEVDVKEGDIKVVGSKAPDVSVIFSSPSKRRPLVPLPTGPLGRSFMPI